MNTMQRYTIYTAALMLMAGALLLSSCTSTVSHRVSADGVPGEVVFPKMEHALDKDGIYPNEENLKKIRPGMSKQDLYYLLGPPHFREIFSAREWDYIFKFSQGTEEKTCQYKVIFDTKRIARSIYWQPKECGERYFTSDAQQCPVRFLHT